jgi:hypothetical protein
MRYLIYETWSDTYFDVIQDRMSEVWKGTSRYAKNENKRRKYI